MANEFWHKSYRPPLPTLFILCAMGGKSKTSGWKAGNDSRAKARGQKKLAKLQLAKFNHLRQLFRLAAPVLRKTV